MTTSSSTSFISEAAPSRSGRSRLIATLALASTVLGLGALWVGPADVSPTRILDDPLAWTVVVELRLPRVLAALLTGAALGLAGALMQALLRNPLADPALVGVSGGAALGATLALALGVAGAVAGLDLAIMALLGASLATLAVWRLGQVRGRLHLTAVLLAGVAINALAGAAVGLMVTLSDDGVLRSVTFWLLGSLVDAGYRDLVWLLPALPAALLWSERRAEALDLYQLGDREARHAGLAVHRTRTLGMLLACLLTALAVAHAGIIGFIGLMVPHGVRMLSGPDHAGLPLASALAGALLLLLADTLARGIAAPAEIPVGLITALIGTPFFLLVLRNAIGERGEVDP